MSTIDLQGLRNLVTPPKEETSQMRMKGQQDVLWKLLEPEYPRAMMFCRKLMGDRDRGDDLYQDALVIACERISDLRDPGAFRPWLYRVIITTFQSTVRRPWWKRVVLMTPEMEHRLTTEDPTDAHSARRWLNRAFNVVSTEDQALLVLHELEGWPIRELAELLTRSEGAVKLRLYRIRRKMRQALLKLHRLPASNETKGSLRREEDRCAAAKSGIE